MAEAEEMPLHHILRDDDPNRELTEPEIESRARALAQLGLVCEESRRESIHGRMLTGIEEEWIEDEEFYEGIDDANRGEMGAWRSKPPGQTAMGDEDDRDGNSGSTVFMNITSPYVDAASARMGDMLLPTDDRSWAIKPTPVPDLVKIGKATLTQSIEDEIEAEHGSEPHRLLLARGKRVRANFPRHVRRQIDDSFDKQAAEAANDPDAAAQVEEGRARTYIRLAEETQGELDEATRLANRAQERIDDWHVECQYHAHMRQVIDDSAKVGTGVLKGPIPIIKRGVAFKGGKLLVQDKQQPASRRVDYWNCYPDPGCGDNIHDGNMHWERDEITRKALGELRSQPDYIVTQINDALEEGPQSPIKEVAEATGRTAHLGMARRDTSKLFEIWYGYLNLDREQLLEAGLDEDLLGELGEQPIVPCQVTMVNNRVILLTVNPLDTGEYPYDYMRWQKRVALPYGRGIARQIRTSQRIVNAAVRNMMDNAGLAGGPMWVVLSDILIPFDGQAELRPRKGWMIRGGATKEEIENALRFFEMPMVQAELQAILEMGLKLAEDTTGMPMLLQGQQGKAPDTVGGMTLLHNNATAVARRVARMFDDYIQEPHIRRYYAYLLMYGDDEEKGDFQIDARGSSSLVERDINNQAIMDMAQMVTNPVFKKDPAKWMDEWLRSQKLDPKRFDYSDDDWQELVQQLAQQAQGGDSSVEVAQIRAESAERIQASKNEMEAAKMALDDERQAREEEYNKAMEVINNERMAWEKMADREMNLDDIRARFSELTLKLQAQFKLAANDGETPQLASPPTEPKGRAPEGQAFQA